MPQNSMTNSNGWTRDSDSDYYIGADEKSLYNSSVCMFICQGNVNL